MISYTPDQRSVFFPAAMVIDRVLAENMPCATINCRSTRPDKNVILLFTLQ
jgi:hypothetical protein